eukprot:TRINITY_DN1910_c0_g1_i1.p1 TRINITY_DN1910_c0_g1~~TRINITY_DN1910_c0_g1_i1.p1  ORF type:complete len:663 (+),score=120.90 TRINITY_DN1910_c0_g1_i1:193-1989(+)
MEMASFLGVPLTEEQALLFLHGHLITNKDVALKFDDFYSWWKTPHELPSVTTEDDPLAPLRLIKLKLRSRSYIRTMKYFAKELQRKASAPFDDLFSLTFSGSVGEFEEPEAKAWVTYTTDEENGRKSRRELKATPTSAILSVSLTVREDVDEFELGELAGTIADIVLLGKKKLQFHSHRSQYVEERGEKVLRFSVFYDEHEQFELVREIINGVDLVHLSGMVELSQRPGSGPQPGFLKGRAKAQVKQRVNIVPFFNNLLNENKKEQYRARLNAISALRNVDIGIKFADLEEAYKRFSLRIPQIKTVRGFHSIKPLIMPLAQEIYNDNSLPDAVKDAYDSALGMLRGVHGFRFQIDNKVIKIGCEGIDALEIFPRAAEIQAWKAPIKRQKPAKNFPPLFGKNEFRLCVLGSAGVGKSTAIVRFVQEIFVRTLVPQPNDTYTKTCYVDGENCLLTISDSKAAITQGDLTARLAQSEGIVIMYSIADSSSFSAVQSFYDSVVAAKKSEPLPPVFIVGTKADLLDSRVVLAKEGADLAKKLKNCYHFEISSTLPTENQAKIMFYDLIRAMQTQRTLELDNDADNVWFGKRDEDDVDESSSSI